MTCGKGGASGFPFAVVLANDTIVEKCADAKMSATFQANPVSCAAALATVRVIESEGLLENASKSGDFFMKSLRDVYEDRGLRGEVRGRGLFMAAELVTDDESRTPNTELAEQISRESIKRGVFVEPGGRHRNVSESLRPLSLLSNRCRRQPE